MREVRVTVIADPNLPVPPSGYGGTERIIASLVEGLVSRGHDVCLMAAAGSRWEGGLVVHRPPSRSYPSRVYRKLLFQPLSLKAAFGRDVVHNFGRVDYLWALLRTPLPILHTFENPVTQPEVDLLTSRRLGRSKLVSISDQQRKGFAARGAWATVFNAVDLGRLPLVREPQGEPYLAFLGRLTANKGVHVAVQVARAARMKLRIAGNISKEPGGEEYFRHQVQPELDDAIEYVGEMTDADKPAFLGNARALLFPVLWDEPFGIVMAEALACGTPVIATRRGAVPEVLSHGHDGFICDSVDEMVSAVRRLDDIPRERCRDACERRFSAERMVDRYVELYRALLAESGGGRGEAA